MDFIKQNKMTIGGIAVVVAVVLIYFMYFSGGSSSATLSTAGGASPIAKDLLIQLQNLHTITLDNSIFKNPAFLSLTDFGVTIPPEPIGRRNPFVPVK